jgi:uncharacterized alkaline shock family protein YloU
MLCFQHNNQLEEVFPMTENKQYINQPQENGSLLISDDVIESISRRALEEIEGFAGLSTRPGADIAELIGKNWGQGIKTMITDDNKLTIECNVMLYYGCNVVSVAQAIQERISSEVETFTGVKVVAVNVNICGVIRK